MHCHRQDIGDSRRVEPGTGRTGDGEERGLYIYLIEREMQISNMVWHWLRQGPTVNLQMTREFLDPVLQVFQGLLNSLRERFFLGTSAVEGSGGLTGQLGKLYPGNEILWVCKVPLPRLWQP
jgi:hypothetical protein